MKAQESLYTDRYELSMLDGALVSGVINAKATFEVFTRSLANGYRYGVVERHRTPPRGVVQVQFRRGHDLVAAPRSTS